MKFFIQKQLFKKTTLLSEQQTKLKTYACLNKYIAKNHICGFSNFFLKTGFLMKSKIILGKIKKNLNNFLYFNNSYIFENYPSIKWVVDDIIEKKLNFDYVFGLITNLIKPPFVVKSILVPKKLRKKTKQKYLIKIVYKNEDKRLKSSYKQLYYYSNKFIDSKFKTRLYKSIMFSFLDWKGSYLFKLKSMVFKKFFKF